MPEKRILGVDFGLQRIGIAVSDPMNIIAQGVRVIQHTPNAVQEIKRLADDYDADVIVVGLPLNLQGNKGLMAETAGKFIAELKHVTGREIVPWDERFTSKSAKDTLLMMGTSKKQRRNKEQIDLLASAIILQGYLDRRKYLMARGQDGGREQ